MQVEIGRARLQPVRQIHVRSPRSKSPPCLSSSGTATTRSHTKVSYNEPKKTVMRAPPRQRALQQHALTHGGNTLFFAGFQPRVRALDLSNAGGYRASPSPTHLPDPCATTRDLSRHRASATAGPEPRDHTAGRSTISPLIPYGLTARTPFSRS